MSDAFIKDIMLCMDDEDGMPIVKPQNVDGLPKIVEKILTPDQLLEFAAMAEMVRKYRYTNDSTAFFEELMWTLQNIRSEENVPLWDLVIRQALKEWFDDELNNSSTAKMGCV
jgi:hypothetical protein